MINDVLAENEYYHGTYDYKALQILYEGFRLKKKFCDYGRWGTFKQGIYLTKSVTIACHFGEYIFKCELDQGTSVLRLDEKYDPKVINYLRREFGRQILDGDISKTIPRNKHLTRLELINLLNYRFCKMGNWVRKDIENKWAPTISSARQQLLLHKYDAIGEVHDLAGLVVFNPSLVKPHTLFHGKWLEERDEAVLEEYDKKRFICTIKETIDESRSEGDQSEKEEANYFETLLERYCRENTIDQTDMVK